jgi:hypothetical protein
MQAIPGRSACFGFLLELTAKLSSSRASRTSHFWWLLVAPLATRHLQLTDLYCGCWYLNIYASKRRVRCQPPSPPIVGQVSSGLMCYHVLCPSKLITVVS